MCVRALGTIAALALLVPAGTAWADVDGPVIVGFVNAQRAAHGIPAGITHRQADTVACRKHNAYTTANGGALVHDEEPGKPGYSDEGRDAAKTSVLWKGKTWAGGINPFEFAPIHLSQVLSPRLDAMGASEDGSVGCATTLKSRNRPAPAANTTYSYPGDAATGWRTQETASEGPYTPGERVGIAKGAVTGPYLYVFFDGPGLTPFSKAKATAASLTGPGGPVAAVTADNFTSGLEGFLPPEVLLIPTAPLAADTAYTAFVAAEVSSSNGGAAVPFERTWTFTTGAAGEVTPPATGEPPTTEARKPATGGAALGFRGVSARVISGELRIPIRCGLPCALKATGTVKSGSTVIKKLAQVKVSLTRAGDATVKFKLPRSVRRRIRAASAPRVVVTITTTSAGAKPATTTKSLPVAR